VTLIQAAMTDRCSLNAACNETDISLRTYRRWLSKGKITVDKRPDAICPEPSNKLTEEERQTILNTCNEPEYANLPPSQIVPTLLDEGIYHASESSYYRVLKAASQLHQRSRSQAPKNVSKPTSYRACKANELWSWDITYLASTVKGQFYYLYLFEDIFSRKVVGYEVYEQECGKSVASVQETCCNDVCYVSNA
jgi:putative transposase